MSHKDIFLAILVPCVLGFGFVIAKPAMESFPPILLNGLRWSLSGLLMCYFFPFPRNFIKQMFAISIIGGSIQYSLSFYGLKMLDGASATLFVQAEIPFGILIAYFLLGEKVPLKNIIGLIVAFVGIAILSGNPNLEGKMIGVILILSGAFLWSLAQVFAKDVSEKIGGLALTAWLGIFSGPQCIIASYFIEGRCLLGFWYFNHVICNFFYRNISFGNNSNNFTASRFYFLNITDYFFVVPFFRSNHK